MDKLRQIQLCELDILNEITAICERNNIDYWLAYGTMLGAVRHQGFIPWDDDMDIYMKYSDFIRFREICQKEMSTDYFLQCPQTDYRMKWLYYKVRKNGTSMPQEWQKEQTESIGHTGIWVDIFPLIDCAESESGFKKQFKALCKLQKIRCNHAPFYLSDNTFKKLLKKMYEWRLNLLEKLLFAYVLMIPGKNSRRYLAVGNGFWNTNKKHAIDNIYPKDWFDEKQQYRFEDTYKCGIKDYDKYLSQIYGKDYMIPIKFNQHVENYDDVIV